MTKPVLPSVLVVFLLTASCGASDEYLQDTVSHETGGSTVVFLSAEDGAQVLTSNTEYISKIMPMEAYLKTGKTKRDSMDLPAIRTEVESVYRNGVKGWLPDEVKAVTLAVGMVQPFFDEHTRLKTSWRFIKTDRTVDRGYSFTVGNHIVIGDWLFDGLNNVETESGLQGATEAAVSQTAVVMGDWLCHEQVHIAQREHPGLFAMLYRSWGFTSETIIDDKAFAAVRLRRFHNPDALDTWVLSLDSGAFVWPLTYISNGVPIESVVEVKPAKGGFEVVANSGGEPAVTEIRRDGPIARKFPGFSVAGYSHPNELSAEALVVGRRLLSLNREITNGTVASLMEALKP